MATFFANRSTALGPGLYLPGHAPPFHGSASMAIIAPESRMFSGGRMDATRSAAAIGSSGQPALAKWALFGDMASPRRQRWVHQYLAICIRGASKRAPIHEPTPGERSVLDALTKADLGEELSHLIQALGQAGRLSSNDVGLWQPFQPIDRLWHGVPNALLQFLVRSSSASLPGDHRAVIAEIGAALLQDPFVDENVEHWPPLDASTRPVQRRIAPMLAHPLRPVFAALHEHPLIAGVSGATATVPSLHLEPEGVDPTPLAGSNRSCPTPTSNGGSRELSIPATTPLLPIVAIESLDATELRVAARLFDQLGQFLDCKALSAEFDLTITQLLAVLEAVRTKLKLDAPNSSHGAQYLLVPETSSNRTRRGAASPRAIGVFSRALELPVEHTEAHQLPAHIRPVPTGKEHRLAWLLNDKLKLVLAPGRPPFWLTSEEYRLVQQLFRQLGLFVSNQRLATDASLSTRGLSVSLLALEHDLFANRHEDAFPPLLDPELDFVIKRELNRGVGLFSQAHELGAASLGIAEHYKDEVVVGPGYVLNKRGGLPHVARGIVCINAERDTVNITAWHVLRLLLAANETPVSFAQLGDALGFTIKHIRRAVKELQFKFFTAYGPEAPYQLRMNRDALVVRRLREEPIEPISLGDVSWGVADPTEMDPLHILRVTTDLSSRPKHYVFNAKARVVLDEQTGVLHHFAGPDFRVCWALFSCLSMDVTVSRLATSSLSSVTGIHAQLARLGKEWPFSERAFKISSSKDAYRVERTGQPASLSHAALRAKLPLDIDTGEVLTAISPAYALYLVRLWENPNAPSTSMEHKGDFFRSWSRGAECIREARDIGEPRIIFSNVMKRLHSPQAEEYLGSAKLLEILRHLYVNEASTKSQLASYGLGPATWQVCIRELLYRLETGPARLAERFAPGTTRAMDDVPVTAPKKSEASDHAEPNQHVKALTALMHRLVDTLPSEQERSVNEERVLAVLHTEFGVEWPTGVSLPQALSHLDPKEDSMLRAVLGLWPYRRSQDRVQLQEAFDLGEAECQVAVNVGIAELESHAVLLAGEVAPQGKAPISLERLAQLFAANAASIQPQDLIALLSGRGLLRPAERTLGLPLSPVQHDADHDGYREAVKRLTGATARTDAIISMRRANPFWQPEELRAIYDVIRAGRNARTLLLLGFSFSLREQLSLATFDRLMQALNLTEEDEASGKNVADEMFAGIVLRTAAEAFRRSASRSSNRLRGNDAYDADAPLQSRFDPEIDTFAGRVAQQTALRRQAQALQWKEIPSLLDAIEAGDRALSDFIAANLRLAVNFAERRGYRPRSARSVDLIEDALDGLHYAAERYDPEAGAFTTYALRIMESIRYTKSIQRIALPLGISRKRAAEVMKTRTHCDRLRESLDQQGFHREPTLEELARAVYATRLRETLVKETRAEPTASQWVEGWKKHLPRYVEKTEENLRLLDDLRRLAAPIGLDKARTESGANLHALIPSAPVVAEETRGDEVLRQRLLAACAEAKLSGQEIMALLRTFGIAIPDSAAALEPIASLANIDTHTMQLLLSRALSKLRRSEAAERELGRYLKQMEDEEIDF